MAKYFKDPEFPHVYWVVSTLDELGRREGVGFWYANPADESKFITLKFKPSVLDEPMAQPRWVDTVRPAWIGFMRRNGPQIPKNLKPNPVLPILQRLSGLEVEKIKAIINLGDLTNEQKA